MLGVWRVDEHPSHSFGVWGVGGIVGVWCVDEHPSCSFGERRVWWGEWSRRTPLTLIGIAEGCGGVRGVDEHPSHSFGEWRSIVGVWRVDESPHTHLESGGSR